MLLQDGRSEFRLGPPKEIKNNQYIINVNIDENKINMNNFIYIIDKFIIC